ncbi:unnamed protein product [Gordionus sp. m RMFG-2023]
MVIDKNRAYNDMNPSDASLLKNRGNGFFKPEKYYRSQLRGIKSPMMIRIAESDLPLKRNQFIPPKIPARKSFTLPHKSLLFQNNTSKISVRAASEQQNYTKTNANTNRTDSDDEFHENYNIRGTLLIPARKSLPSKHDIYLSNRIHPASRYELHKADINADDNDYPKSDCGYYDKDVYEEIYSDPRHSLESQDSVPHYKKIHTVGTQSHFPSSPVQHYQYRVNINTDDIDSPLSPNQTFSSAISDFFPSRSSPISHLPSCHTVISPIYSSVSPEYGDLYEQRKVNNRNLKSQKNNLDNNMRNSNNDRQEINNNIHHSNCYSKLPLITRYMNSQTDPCDDEHLKLPSHHRNRDSLENAFVDFERNASEYSYSSNSNAAQNYEDKSNGPRLTDLPPNLAKSKKFSDPIPDSNNGHVNDFETKSFIRLRKFSDCTGYDRNKRAIDLLSDQEIPRYDNTLKVPYKSNGVVTSGAYSNRHWRLIVEGEGLDSDGKLYKCSEKKPLDGCEGHRNDYLGYNGDRKKNYIRDDHTSLRRLNGECKRGVNNDFKTCLNCRHKSYSLKEHHCQINTPDSKDSTYNKGASDNCHSDKVFNCNKNHDMKDDKDENLLVPHNLKTSRRVEARQNVLKLNMGTNNYKDNGNTNQSSPNQKYAKNVTDFVSSDSSKNPSFYAHLNGNVTQPNFQDNECVLAPSKFDFPMDLSDLLSESKKKLCQSFDKEGKNYTDFYANHFMAHSEDSANHECDPKLEQSMLDTPEFACSKKDIDYKLKDEHESLMIANKAVPIEDYQNNTMNTNYQSINGTVTIIPIPREKSLKFITEFDEVKIFPKSNHTASDISGNRPDAIIKQNHVTPIHSKDPIDAIIHTKNSADFQILDKSCENAETSLIHPDPSNTEELSFQKQIETFSFNKTKNSGARNARTKFFAEPLITSPPKSVNGKNCIGPPKNTVSAIKDAEKNNNSCQLLLELKNHQTKSTPISTAITETILTYCSIYANLSVPIITTLGNGILSTVDNSPKIISASKINLTSLNNVPTDLLNFDKISSDVEKDFNKNLECGIAFGQCHSNTQTYMLSRKNMPSLHSNTLTNTLSIINLPNIDIVEHRNEDDLARKYLPPQENQSIKMVSPNSSSQKHANDKFKDRCENEKIFPNSALSNKAAFNSTNPFFTASLYLVDQSTNTLPLIPPQPLPTLKIDVGTGGSLSINHPFCIMCNELPPKNTPVPDEPSIPITCDNSTNTGKMDIFSKEKRDMAIECLLIPETLGSPKMSNTDTSFLENNTDSSAQKPFDHVDSLPSTPKAASLAPPTSQLLNSFVETYRLYSKAGNMCLCPLCDSMIRDAAKTLAERKVNITLPASTLKSSLPLISVNKNINVKTSPQNPTLHIGDNSHTNQSTLKPDEKHLILNRTDPNNLASSQPSPNISTVRSCIPDIHNLTHKSLPDHSSCQSSSPLKVVIANNNYPDYHEDATIPSANRIIPRTLLSPSSSIKSDGFLIKNLARPDDLISIPDTVSEMCANIDRDRIDTNGYDDCHSARIEAFLSKERIEEIINKLTTKRASFRLKRSRTAAAIIPSNRINDNAKQLSSQDNNSAFNSSCVESDEIKQNYTVRSRTNPDIALKDRNSKITSPPTSLISPEKQTEIILIKEEAVKSIQSNVIISTHISSNLPITSMPVINNDFKRESNNPTIENRDMFGKFRYSLQNYRRKMARDLKTASPLPPSATNVIFRSKDDLDYKDGVRIEYNPLNNFDESPYDIKNFTKDNCVSHNSTSNEILNGHKIRPQPSKHLDDSDEDDATATEEGHYDVATNRIILTASNNKSRSPTNNNNNPRWIPSFTSNKGGKTHGRFENSSLNNGNKLNGPGVYGISSVNNLLYYEPIMEDPAEKYTIDPDFDKALKIVNESFLKKDESRHTENTINKMKKIIVRQWFDLIGSKSHDEMEDDNYLAISAGHVEFHLDHFESLSRNLLTFVVNCVDDMGNTALHYSISYGNFDIVSTLLDSKVCDLNAINNAGYTPIMLTALAKYEKPFYLEVAKRLYQIGDLNIKAKQNGQTALMLAASHDRKDVCRNFLECGADPNIKDSDGSTALMCAAEHGHAEVAKILLSHPEIDTDIADNDGSTALAIAVKAGHKDIGILIYAHQNLVKVRHMGGSDNSKLTNTQSSIIRKYSNTYV